MGAAQLGRMQALACRRVGQPCAAVSLPSREPLCTAAHHLVPPSRLPAAPPPRHRRSIAYERAGRLQEALCDLEAAEAAAEQEEGGLQEAAGGPRRVREAIAK